MDAGYRNIALFFVSTRNVIMQRRRILSKKAKIDYPETQIEKLCRIGETEIIRESGEPDIDIVLMVLDRLDELEIQSRLQTMLN